VSIQQQLLTAILERYPDAEGKKVDEDNYLDIHLPSVHPKRGTHLFFNTARSGIKLGLHCRDEEFLSRAIETNGLIERTSNGLRPLGNPTFEDVAAALRAARDFITLLQRSAGAPVTSRTARASSAPTASIDRRGGKSTTSAAHVLTAAVADAFIVDSSSVDLTEFTEITSDAAKRLSEADAILFLDGLTEISDEVLRSVTDSNGGLSLDGLTTLSDYQADVLGSYAGPSLWLNGLTELSEDAKESLLRFDGVLHCELLGKNPFDGVHIQTVDETLASLEGNSVPQAGGEMDLKTVVSFFVPAWEMTPHDAAEKILALSHRLKESWSLYKWGCRIDGDDWITDEARLMGALQQFAQVVRSIKEDPDGGWLVEEIPDQHLPEPVITDRGFALPKIDLEENRIDFSRSFIVDNEGVTIFLNTEQFYSSEIGTGLGKVICETPLGISCNMNDVDGDYFEFEI